MTEIKLFNRWSTNVEIKDPGLKNYINLKPLIVPKTYGRHASQQFHKSSDVNIIERIMNKMYVPGHRGKKHLLSSGRCGGNSMSAWKNMVETLDLIEKRTKKNPIEVIVKAIENAALREEITSFQMGGIMARKAVLSSPQRRVDLVLRLLTQGAYQKAYAGHKKTSQCLADEFIAAYENDATKSNAIREKERIERDAAGAR
jgi:small subunit ribosomal protein S7